MASERPPTPDGRRSGPDLVLACRRPDGSAEQLYLEPGLTIRRGAGNTVSVPDESVDCLYARVESDADGTPRLRCAKPGCCLLVGDRAVPETALAPGCGSPPPGPSCSSASQAVADDPPRRRARRRPVPAAASRTARAGRPRPGSGLAADAGGC